MVVTIAWIYALAALMWMTFAAGSFSVDMAWNLESSAMAQAGQKLRTKNMPSLARTSNL